MSRRVAQISREYQSLRASFQQLAHSIGRIGSMLAQAAAVDGVAGAEARRPLRRRKPRLTSSRRAALRLQGKYMGTIRGMKPRQQARIKKIRAEKGFRAAITAAVRMAR